MADLAALRRTLSGYGRVVVAFSGGADSAFLAWVAHDTLGATGAVAVTAVSPSLASFEHADCQALAGEWGLRFAEVHTDELARAAYRANDADRCFHCKDALMRALTPIAAAEDAVVVLGVNVDDLSDHRPGQRAAARRGARFPLVEAGFTKADVRAASRSLGLRTWDKPAAACLASRVPYGTPVTIETLASVEAAESGLRALGFVELRVRHSRDTARIEVPLERLADVVAQRADVVGAVKAAGYRYVTLDLEGLRSGNLNDALRIRPASASMALVAPPADPADEAALAGHARALADAVEEALPRWVERCVARFVVIDEPTAVQVARAGARARTEIGARVRALLETDVDEQRGNPLALLRAAVRYPTEVLRAAGVAPVARDEFDVRVAPDDAYGLAPASFADVDPSLREPGLEWGAAKAHVFKQRRRAEGRG